MHLVVDSTGVKVYGRWGMENQDSWLSRQRVQLRKLHLGVNEATVEIVTAVVTTNDVSDDQVFSDLLDGVEGEIAEVSGEVALDKYQCYETAHKRGIKTTIPPRKNAVPQRSMATVKPYPLPEMRTSDEFVK